MKKIVIVNAYGAKNIGDSAIQAVSLNFINSVLLDSAQVVVLCEDPGRFRQKNLSKIKVRPMYAPYGYAIRGGNSPASYPKKLFRFSVIILRSILASYLYKLRLITLPSKGFYAYIKVLSEADLVLGMGGGYFISKHKIRDYFGLILTLLPIYISKLFKKKILFLPMSIGPFASESHLRLISYALENTTVMYREQISRRILQKINKNKKIRSLYGPDLALFYKFHRKVKLASKLQSNYAVLTAREWLPKAEQMNLEEQLIRMVRMIWNDYGLKTVFLPMAFNPTEDDDNRVAKRMSENIHDTKIFQVKHVTNPGDAQEILAKSRINVCMRMHSMILSMTSESPFIPIGYGHKTIGILKSFNLEDWLIDVQNIDGSRLNEKIISLLSENKYKKFIKVLRAGNKRLIEERSIILKALRQAVIGIK